MAYIDLYEYAQTLDVHVSRKELRDKSISVCGIEKIAHIRTGMDLGVARGYWLTPQNTEHHLVQQHGCHVVVTARDLNRCWERFVFVKEMMHLFDMESGRTGDQALLDSLLSEFAGQKPTQHSPQMVEEILASWRALALLCPESLRLEFAADREAVRIDDYEIALRLRIPQQFVPNLFSEHYPAMLGMILGR